jgi:hypothetical protein
MFAAMDELLLWPLSSLSSVQRPASASLTAAVCFLVWCSCHAMLAAAFLPDAHRYVVFSSSASIRKLSVSVQFLQANLDLGRILKRSFLFFTETKS